MFHQGVTQQDLPRRALARCTALIVVYEDGSILTPQRKSRLTELIHV